MYNIILNHQKYHIIYNYLFIFFSITKKFTKLSVVHHIKTKQLSIMLQFQNVG